MPTVEGAHQRRSGSKRAYFYQLTYEYRQPLLEWSAVVSRGGVFKGRPRGSVALPFATVSELLVAAEDQVCDAIERLIDVVE